jgi:hypothetical protein
MRKFEEDKHNASDDACDEQITQKMNDPSRIHSAIIAAYA